MTARVPKGKPDCTECHGRGRFLDCSTDELDVCPPEVPCSLCNPSLHAEARAAAIEALLRQDYVRAALEQETTGQLMFYANMLFWPPPETKEI